MVYSDDISYIVTIIVTVYDIGVFQWGIESRIIRSFRSKSTKTYDISRRAQGSQTRIVQLHTEVEVELAIGIDVCVADR